MCRIGKNARVNQGLENRPGDAGRRSRFPFFRHSHWISGGRLVAPCVLAWAILFDGPIATARWPTVSEVSAAGQSSTPDQSSTPGETPGLAKTTRRASTIALAIPSDHLSDEASSLIGSGIDDGANQGVVIDDAATDPMVEDTVDIPPLVSSAGVTANSPETTPGGGRVGYDRGFFIESDEWDEQPFRLKVNLQNQFRYTGFSRSENQWTDAAGNDIRIANRNDFDINRGRVIFSGYAIDPDLNFYLNLDYATLGNDRVTVLLAWLNYKFHRSFELYFGKGKVPGGREWLLTSVNSMAPDRSMATTFFRPSITTGIWATGEPVDNLRYQAIIGNGFNTSSAGFRDLDTNFVYAGNVWWEPQGEFGGLYSDLSRSETPVTRFGTSLTTSRQSGSQAISEAPEESFIRLSDGTDFTEPGALAPGVSVTEYSIFLASLDAGWKYRGVSLTGEYFFRRLSDIQGNGPIPAANRDLFDHGFYAQVGCFVVPSRWEVFTRTSQIYGPFGDGGEYAVGFNWYVRGTADWRFGFDLAKLVDSPADQIRTGYDAGASGVLIRGQMQTVF
jgi:hypothetical protein